MAGVTIRIVDASALNGFRRIAERAPERLQATIEAFVLDAHSEAIDLMRSSRPSGRVYRRGKGGRTHRASAPGQPPAIDTGNLVGHVEFDVGPGFGELGATVMTGLWMEQGTSRVRPRPWLLPAISKSEEKLKRAIENVFEDVAP